MVGTRRAVLLGVRTGFQTGTTSFARLCVREHGLQRCTADCSCTMASLRTDPATDPCSRRGNSAALSRLCSTSTAVTCTAFALIPQVSSLERVSYPQAPAGMTQPSRARARPRGGGGGGTCCCWAWRPRCTA